MGSSPAALGQRGARVEQAVRHVVEDALVLGEEELLEDETDPRGSQSRELTVGQRSDVEPRHQHPAGGRAVEGAHQMQEGRLARPRGANNRKQFPLPDGETDPAQSLDRRLDGVGLGDLLELQDRAGRRRRGRECSARGSGEAPLAATSYVRNHYSLADVHTRPAHLHVPAGVVEQADLDRFEVVGAVRRGHLHGVPATGQGDKGLHRDHQRVRDALFRDPDVYRQVVQVAGGGRVQGRDVHLNSGRRATGGRGGDGAHVRHDPRSCRVVRQDNAHLVADRDFGLLGGVELRSAPAGR